MAPRVHRGAIVCPKKIRLSELHSDAGVDGRFCAGVGALARTSNGADTRFGVVVETELVLPVAIGNPSGHELRVLRTPEGLGSIEGQTDRFAVQLGLARGACNTDTGADQRGVRVTLRSIPASATADGEIVD